MGKRLTLLLPAACIGVGTVLLGVSIYIWLGYIFSEQRTVPEKSIAMQTSQVAAVQSTPIPTIQKKQPEDLDLLHDSRIYSHVYLWNGVSWEKIPQDAISLGVTIRIGIASATHQGIFDLARFRQNGGEWVERTEVNEFGEFFIQYTVTQENSPLVIETQIHHNTEGWR